MRAAEGGDAHPASARAPARARRAKTTPSNLSLPPPKNAPHLSHLLSLSSPPPESQLRRRPGRLEKAGRPGSGRPALGGRLGDEKRFGLYGVGLAGGGRGGQGRRRRRGIRCRGWWWWGWGPVHADGLAGAHAGPLGVRVRGARGGTAGKKRERGGWVGLGMERAGLGRRLCHGVCLFVCVCLQSTAMCVCTTVRACAAGRAGGGLSGAAARKARVPVFFWVGGGGVRSGWARHSQLPLHRPCENGRAHV